MTAFEILVNGKRVCVAGANRGLNAGVFWTRFKDEEGGFGFDMGGDNDDKEWKSGCVWPMPAVGLGDEITLRLISTDSIDTPHPRVSKAYPKPPTPPARSVWLREKKDGDMSAFEILVNGKRVCVAGANRLLLAGLGWTPSKVEDGEFDFNVGGTNDEEGWERRAVWSVPVVGVGDEITIRIVSTDSVDPPSHRILRRPPTAG